MSLRPRSIHFDAPVQHCLHTKERLFGDKRLEITASNDAEIRNFDDARVQRIAEKLSETLWCEFRTLPCPQPERRH